MADALDVKQAHIVAQWPHERPLVSCRIDPKGRFVFAGSEDRSVQRFSLTDGQKTPFVAHESWVYALGFSNDGEQTITGGAEGRLLWWPTTAEKPEPIRQVDAHQGWIRSISVRPDGSMLATGGNDAAVRLWNPGDGKLIRELTGHDRPIYSLQFHPSGEFLLSGDLVGVIKQWNAATGELVRSFDAKALHTYEGGQQVDYGGVRTIAVSGDGKHLTAGGLHKATNPLGAVNEPLALLWEWESQKLLHSHLTEGIAGGALTRLQFLSNGSIIGASGGSSGGFLLFWNPDAEKDIHRLAMPNNLRDMDVHSDGLRVVTAHADGHIRVTRLAAPAAAAS